MSRIEKVLWLLVTLAVLFGASSDDAEGKLFGRRKAKKNCNGGQCTDGGGGGGYNGNGGYTGTVPDQYFDQGMPAQTSTGTVVGPTMVVSQPTMVLTAKPADPVEEIDDMDAAILLSIQARRASEAANAAVEMIAADRQRAAEEALLAAEARLLLAKKRLEDQEGDVIRLRASVCPDLPPVPSVEDPMAVVVP